MYLRLERNYSDDYVGLNADGFFKREGGGFLRRGEG